MEENSVVPNGDLAVVDVGDARVRYVMSRAAVGSNDVITPLSDHLVCPRLPPPSSPPSNATVCGSLVQRRQPTRAIGGTPRAARARAALLRPGSLVVWQIGLDEDGGAGSPGGHVVGAFSEALRLLGIAARNGRFQVRAVVNFGQVHDGVNQTRPASCRQVA